MYKVLETNGLNLTPNEKRIVDQINKTPEDFLNVSINDFAYKTNSNISSISRLAKKINNSTYKEFLIIINKNYYLIKENTDIFKLDNSEKITKKIRNYLFLAINETMRRVDVKTLEKLILNLLKPNNLICLIGNGKAHSAAHDMHFSLFLEGINNILFHSFEESEDVIKKINNTNKMAIFYSEDNNFEYVQKVCKNFLNNGWELFLITPHEEMKYLSKNTIITFSYNYYEGEKPIFDSSTTMNYVNDIIIYMLKMKE